MITTGGGFISRVSRSTSNPPTFSILISEMTICGEMLGNASIAFWAELYGKAWWPLSRHRVEMTSTIAGSSSIIRMRAILRKDYCIFERLKARIFSRENCEMRKTVCQERLAVLPDTGVIRVHHDADHLPAFAQGGADQHLLRRDGVARFQAGA